MRSLLSDALISVYLQLPEECRAWHQHERTSPDPALQAKTSLCFSRATQTVSGKSCKPFTLIY